MSDFHVGQIFEWKYPPQAAVWCDQNNCRIESNGHLRIIVKKAMTHESLINFVTVECEKTAYGGIEVEKAGRSYIFPTTPENITLCNGLATAMAAYPDEASVSWEVLDNGVPVMLPIAKREFFGGFGFGTQMITAALAVKGQYNEAQSRLTDEQLADDAVVSAFKQEVLEALKAIPKRYSLDLLSKIPAKETGNDGEAVQ